MRIPNENFIMGGERMWILTGEGEGYKKWNCSNCNLLVRNSQKPWYKFCPNCGEYMGGEKSNDTTRKI